MKNLVLSFIYLMCFYSYTQDIAIEPFATGLNNPVCIKHAGDNRLFVIERSGYIQIVNEDGTVNMSPFLNIDSRVTNSGGEQGFLALAFHPDYATNGYFYVNYINNSGNTVISRFTRSTANLADQNSELILLNINQPFSNHNGGDMAFGNDGYLYISTGDGGSGGDPGNRSQNLGELLGKMLRIDVNNVSGGNNYAIPATNPFISNASALDEIWAYGLRNPWKFSFDKQTNDLWIADVGQNEIEEINKVGLTDSGVNYGWRCYEGDAVYNTSVGCPDMNTLTFPVAQYTHSSSGAFKCSITGGYIYRGTAQPNLQGLYFFADYCSNEIGILENVAGNWNMTFTEQFSGNNWSCFAEDVNGEIYIAGLNSGNIFKIIDANLSIDEQDFFNIKMYPNPADTYLTFDLTHSNIQLQEVNIIDIHGKFIKSITNFDAALTTVSTKDLSKGLYLVEMTSTNGSKKTNKLIIR